MIEKVNKYWSQRNGTLAIATILDPRNKTNCVDHYCRRLYNEGADLELERIRAILRDLLAEYQKTGVQTNEE